MNVSITSSNAAAAASRSAYWSKNGCGVPYDFPCAARRALAERGRPLVQLLADRRRLAHQPRLVDGVGEVAHELEPLDAVARQELGGAAEQVGGGAHVGAVVGAPAGRAEVAGRARASASASSPVAELRAVAVGLLEVVAEDLVVLADALAGARSSQSAYRSCSAARSFFAVAR